VSSESQKAVGQRVRRRRRDGSVVSRNMAAIRSRGTVPELMLRRLLRALAKPLRVNVRTLPGSPDVVFPRHHVAVFMDGCFWHGCPQCYVRPRINRSYWSKKIIRNQKRDRRVTRALRLAGWSVVRLWACRLSGSPELCSGRVRRVIQRRSKP